MWVWVAMVFLPFHGRGFGQCSLLPGSGQGRETARVGGREDNPHMVRVLVNGSRCAQLTLSGHRRVLVEISDGLEMVRSTMELDPVAGVGVGRMVGCSLTRHPEAVGTFTRSCKAKEDERGREGVLSALGEQGWRLHMEMEGEIGRCRSFQRERAALATTRTWPPQPRSFAENSAENFAENSAEDSAESPVPHRAKRGLTYPGTLWCGMGNNADTYQHLGEFSETDKCCREHDHCAHVIHPLMSNYGHRNFRWHTLSHCDCDNRLKQCLRDVNNTASRVVGQAFFNVLGVPCFDFVYEEQCVERYWYGWCRKYDRVPIAVPRDSVLYDYGGDLIDDLILRPEPGSEEPMTLPPASIPPAFTAAPGSAKAEQSTLGQMLNVAEDVLKVMATVTQSSAHCNDPGGATGTDERKASEKGRKKERKGKKGKKRRKGKGRKKHRKAKCSTSTNRFPGLEDQGMQSKNFLGEVEKIGSDKHLKQNVLDNSLQLERSEDIFNHVMNDDPYRAQPMTPTSQTFTQAVLKPDTNFHLRTVENPAPRETTTNPKLYHQVPTESVQKRGHLGGFVSDEILSLVEEGPNSKAVQKGTSAKTLLKATAHKEEPLAPLDVRRNLKLVEGGSKLEANHPAHASQQSRGKNRKQRRKGKGRKKHRQKSQQKKGLGFTEHTSVSRGKTARSELAN
uniref:phospholipase A2 n=2 Tax=Callorhinchus milii TaxID=7868 RepID=A0A4W3KDB7_CALMI|eukprot:gi/632958090/ref/XP_007894837.1/ PREDICTED: protein PROCA1 [Callorhinchus milii]